MNLFGLLYLLKDYLPYIVLRRTDLLMFGGCDGGGKMWNPVEPKEGLNRGMISSLSSKPTSVQQRHVHLLFWRGL
jgi:hypothetical protein